VRLRRQDHLAAPHLRPRGPPAHPAVRTRRWGTARSLRDATGAEAAGMSHVRVRWLSGIGDERIVLTTEPNDFAEGERIHELELRTLLWRWLADRNATEELASL